MRTAIYYAPPPDHPLAIAAASWLGRDAYNGAGIDRGPVSGFDPARLDALTAEPRRYGFHATLKPPFRFAAGRDIAGLRRELAAFCRDHAPVLIPALRLERLGSFFALTPGEALPPLLALAEAAVRDFDGFRAPPTGEEIARRNPERLTSRQREHLAAWGYPYVFDEFRFHMTLTGAVPDARRDAVDAVLRARFADFIGQPLSVDTICLFVEPDPPGDFVVDTAVTLTGSRA